MLITNLYSYPMSRGIYILDTTSPNRSAGIRNLPWIDGYSLRPRWSELEPTQGNYQWTIITDVVGNMPATQLLTLEIQPPEPAYVVSAAATTYHHNAGQFDQDRPVPWDTTALTLYNTFLTALSQMTIADPSRGGQLMAFKDHSQLRTVLPSPMGLVTIRDPVGTGQPEIQDLPGYTRQGLLDALQVLHDHLPTIFPRQVLMQGLWPIVDPVSSPPLWQAVLNWMGARYGGRYQLWQENWAYGGTPTPVGRPTTAALGLPLFTGRFDYPMAMQALTGWTPQSNPNVIDGTPAQGIAFALATYHALYYELYVGDIDNSSYQAGLQAWSAVLRTLRTQPAPYGTSMRRYADMTGKAVSAADVYPLLVSRMIGMG